MDLFQFLVEYPNEELTNNVNAKKENDVPKW